MMLQPRLTTLQTVVPNLESVMRAARVQIHRFRVLLEYDRRNVRQFRAEHPDTEVVLLVCVVAVLVGVLIGQV